MDIDQVRTVAVNVFVIMELFYLFNCRSLTQSVFKLDFFTNMSVFGGVAIMLLVQMVYTYLPMMNHLFQSAPIDGGSWLRIIVAGLLAFLIVEVEKWLLVRFSWTARFLNP